MTHSISKTAKDYANLREPVFFYDSAREAMRDFLAHCLTDSNQSVLLPAFIGWSPNEGSGVFDPVSAMEVPFDFYALQPDLTVDMNELEEKLSSGKFRVLVLIHYFGRTEPMLSAVKALADQYEVLLVEDLAHGFFSSTQGGVAGSVGHVKLFSLHKMFPLGAGGMITYADLDLVSDQVSSRADLAVEILSYNWPAIAQARRTNFQEIAFRLAQLPECGTNFELLWPELEVGDVPQTLPVRIFDSSRDHIYRKMNASGFGMVSLYHTLISQVQTGFDSMTDLSRHIINFPVHQDVTPDSLDDLVRAFHKVLKS